MTKLSTKFEICTKYNRTSRYILTFEEASGRYVLQNQTCLEDAYNAPVKYSAKFVQEAIDCGNWIVTKDMSPATEPELVLPFTAQHKDTPEDTEIFVVTKGYDKGCVTCTYPNDGNVSYSNCFTEDDAKKFIKDGTWIVKNVGEKAPEEPVEAPQSTPLSSLSITITADTDAAAGAVERLTASYEALAITLESVIALYKELREVV